MGLFLFALLVYTIIYRKRYLLQCAIFIRRIWVLPLFASIMILCLEVAGSFITLASNFFAIDPYIVDYGRAGFKVLIALFLFSLFLPLQQALKIPGKATFYGNIAILLVALGVFIAAFLDITFIPLFLSVFLLTVLSRCISIPFLTYLCGFSLPLLCLRLFENMLARNGTELARFILSGDILTLLYLAIIILPFMFILERAEALAERRRGRKKQRNISNIAKYHRAILLWRLTFTVGLLVVVLALFVIYMIWMENAPLAEPTRRVLLEDTGTTVSDTLIVKTSSQVFLGRRTIQIELTARGDPTRFDLYLDSNDGTPPILYSAPMPSELNEERNSLTLLMGEDPPNPLTLEIVLSLDFSGDLRVEALYTVWDPAIDSQPPPTTGDYLLRVSKTAPIL
jgi:hypothetical protein